MIVIKRKFKFDKPAPNADVAIMMWCSTRMDGDICWKEDKFFFPKSISLTTEADRGVFQIWRHNFISTFPAFTMFFPQWVNVLLNDWSYIHLVKDRFEAVEGVDFHIVDETHAMMLRLAGETVFIPAEVSGWKEALAVVKRIREEVCRYGQ